MVKLNKNDQLTLMHDAIHSLETLRNTQLFPDAALRNIADIKKAVRQRVISLRQLGTSAKEFMEFRRRASRTKAISLVGLLKSKIYSPVQSKKMAGEIKNAIKYQGITWQELGLSAKKLNEVIQANNAKK